MESEDALLTSMRSRVLATATKAVIGNWFHDNDFSGGTSSLVVHPIFS